MASQWRRWAVEASLEKGRQREVRCQGKACGEPQRKRMEYSIL
jgi:hypothetical protein